MRYARADYSTLDGAVGGLAGGLFVAASAAAIFPAARLGSAWLPLNLIASTIDQSWARLDHFHWLATPYGLLIHLCFSLCVGVLIAWASSRSFLWATLTGGIVAGLFWFVADGSWLPMLSPAFERAVPSSLMLAGHLTLGFIAGAYLDARGRTIIVEAPRPMRARRARPSRAVV